MRSPCELSTVARIVTGRDSGTARVTSPSQVCSSESNSRRLVGRSSAWMLPAEVTALIGPSMPVRKMGPAPLSQRTPPRAEAIRMLPPAVAAITSPRALPTRMLPPEVFAETSPAADETAHRDVAGASRDLRLFRFRRRVDLKIGRQIAGRARGDRLAPEQEHAAGHRGADLHVFQQPARRRIVASPRPHPDPVSHL